MKPTSVGKRKPFETIKSEDKRMIVTTNTLTRDERIGKLMYALNCTREQAEQTYEQNAVPLELGRLVIRLGLAEHIRSLAEKMVGA